MARQSGLVPVMPARFFWGWLIAASAASVAGNVTHAILSAPPSPVIAAFAAIVPPAVQIGATHGVGVLVRSNASGVAYRAALAMTVALAVSAFILSFGALRDLAERWAGYPPAVAWLWPIAVDLSVALSTVALLALGRADDAPAVQLRSVDAPAEHGAALRIVGDDAPAEQDKASAVLDALAGGMRPSTVARQLGMGYATVCKIRDAA